jgi:hypothetical protein
VSFIWNVVGSDRRRNEWENGLESEILGALQDSGRRVVEQGMRHDVRSSCPRRQAKLNRRDV